VIVPIISPGLAATALISLSAWNEFFLAAVQDKLVPGGPWVR